MHRMCLWTLLAVAGLLGTSQETAGTRMRVPQKLRYRKGSIRITIRDGAGAELQVRPVSK